MLVVLEAGNRLQQGRGLHEGVSSVQYSGASWSCKPHLLRCYLPLRFRVDLEYTYKFYCQGETAN
jgi:hypothetical protein